MYIKRIKGHTRITREHIVLDVVYSPNFFEKLFGVKEKEKQVCTSGKGYVYDKYRTEIIWLEYPSYKMIGYNSVFDNYYNTHFMSEIKK